MSTLNINLTRLWFDLWAMGIKTEDYRKMKAYWERRFLEPYLKDYVDPMTGEIKSYRIYLAKEFETVRFMNGMSKTAPVAEFEFKGISEGTVKPEWSGGQWVGETVYKVKGGKLLSIENWSGPHPNTLKYCKKWGLKMPEKYLIADPAKSP